MNGSTSASSGSRTSGGRNTPGKRALRAVAAQAAVLSAAVHFLWAWPRLSDPADPRPYVFVLGGVFIALIAAATLKADEYRRLYALGAGTLSGFLFGYIGWHGSEVAGVLLADPLAIVSKSAELVGVVSFILLFRLAPPTSVVVERRRRESERDRASPRTASGNDDGAEMPGDGGAGPNGSDDSS